MRIQKINILVILWLKRIIDEPRKHTEKHKKILPIDMKNNKNKFCVLLCNFVAKRIIDEPRKHIKTHRKNITY